MKQRNCVFEVWDFCLILYIRLKMKMDIFNEFKIDFLIIYNEIKIYTLKVSQLKCILINDSFEWLI